MQILDFLECLRQEKYSGFAFVFVLQQECLRLIIPKRYSKFIPYFIKQMGGKTEIACQQTVLELVAKSHELLDLLGIVSEIGEQPSELRLEGYGLLEDIGHLTHLADVLGEKCSLHRLEDILAIIANSAKETVHHLNVVDTL